MDAATIPFPTELTTPPLTKMYFVILSFDMCIIEANPPSLSREKSAAFLGTGCFHK